VATNLVPGDVNGKRDIFVRDRLAQTTRVVSRSTSGAWGNDDAEGGLVSGDGRFVAFSSEAANLVGGDMNSDSDAFIHELATGVTTCVSLALTSVPAGGSYAADISFDGRFVALISASAMLVSGDTNNNYDVFLHDRLNGTTTRVNVDSSGAQANALTSHASMSDDGRYVAFISTANNLVAGDTNGQDDAFVHDCWSGVTIRASVGVAGNQATARTYDAALSPNGRFVVFSSNAPNLVPGDGNQTTDVFVRDLQLATTRRVSLDSNGVEANDYSQLPHVASDGSAIFQSFASNLVPGEIGGYRDVFRYDLLSSAMTRISVTSLGGEANGHSWSSDVSADGRLIAFACYAPNVVPGDTNGKGDIFVYRLLPSSPTNYCTSGTTSTGCVPAILASTNPSASALVPCPISVAQVPGNSVGLFFYGIDNSSFVAPTWGSGSSVLCVRAPAFRTPLQATNGSDGLCDGHIGVDWTAFQGASPDALGHPWVAGASAFVQAWLRDPPAPKSSSLSNALELTYWP
jgi:Tol biopolymer transport system component